MTNHPGLSGTEGIPGTLQMDNLFFQFSEGSEILSEVDRTETRELTSPSPFHLITEVTYLPGDAENQSELRALVLGRASLSTLCPSMCS